MSTKPEKQRYLRSHAKLAAERFIQIIESYCERVEIAGSIRRGVDPVSDIEIVVIPKVQAMQRGLLGDVGGPELDLLHQEVMRLVEDPGIPHLVPRNFNGRTVLGERTKYLLWQGYPLDLFAVKPPSQWGAQFAIRTGPAKWNQILVTSKSQQGAMPYGMYQQDGALWKGDPKRGGIIIETPEEVDWFAALGVPYLEPHERTVERLRSFLNRKEKRRDAPA